MSVHISRVCMVPFDCNSDVFWILTVTVEATSNSEDHDGI